ncbi:uncharacterized protein [Clytia hemisphaerica]|uniref:MACPF domain-containing protein n=1 Tax=Clytia hemisphaerica TaxID=252671 RepID=A0A7M5XM63_9CNID
MLATPLDDLSKQEVASEAKVASEATIEERKSLLSIENGSKQSKGSKWLRHCCKWQFFILWLLSIITALIYIFHQNVLQPNVISFKTNPFTLGKIENREIELCNSNQMKRSFPDFDYALYGYNILFGYPLAVGHDPGLTHPIFQADYSDTKRAADCRYQVPKGYDLVPDVSCVTSFTSQTVKNSRQFSKELSVSAEVSGGGYGVSFSASSEYKKKETSMSASESVYVFSVASCNYYFSLLNENAPPKLTKDFINRAKELKTENDVFKFFNYYGTHFMTYTLFGARFVYENKMSQESFKSESEKSVSVSVKASYSGTFSLGGGFGMSDSQRQAAEDFQSKVETKTISIGAPPPADGNTMTWASTVKDTPVPVRFKLDSIENLFSSLYMAGEDIDFESKRKLIASGKLNYCKKELEEKGIVDSCDMKSQAGSRIISLTGLTLHLPRYTGRYQHYKVNRDKCENKCINDDRCIVFEFAPSQCYLYFYKKGSNTTTSKKYEMSKGPGEGTFIFFDALKLLGHTLRVENVTVKESIAARAIVHANKENDCVKECQEDQACEMLTYNRKGKAEDENNCKLFSDDKFECLSDEKDCKIIEPGDSYTDFVTIFNP